MWWCVVLTSKREVHVYPRREEGEHILKDALCNCMPDVRQTGQVQMVVHRKIGEEQPVLQAHWV